MSESGWLIVRRGFHGALYWSGTVFSGDVGEAIRFSRSLDAERVVARLSLSDAEVLPVPVTRTAAAAPSWRDG